MPKPARPKSIRVAAFDIRVVTLDPQNRQDHGTFDAARQEMALSSEFATPTIEVETLLHETMHAIWWAYGIRDGDGEERTVGTMSTGLLQVWRDNPEFVEWISHSAKKSSITRA